MKKIKTLALYLSVGFILFAPISGLIPYFTPSANAAPADEASVEELMDSYIYTRAVLRCLYTNPDPAPDPGKVDSFDFLGGADTFIGYLDDGNEDGKEDCNEDWINSAYGLWGLGADVAGNGSEGTRAACYSGYDRENSPGQQASDCVKGTGDFSYQSEAPEQFIRNVTRVYYGKESSTLPSMSKAMEYYYYSQSFLVLCKPTDTGLTMGNGADQYTPQEVGDNSDLIYMTDPNGDDRVYEMRDKNTGDEVTTRATEGREVKLKCGDLAVNARSEGRQAAYAAAVADGSASGVDNSGTPLDGSAEGTEIQCSEGGGFSGSAQTLNPFNWLMCPFVNAFAGVASGMEDIITGMLCINESDIFSTNITCSGGGAGSSESREGFYSAWNVFRILALAMIAIAGLVMVISQALGFEFIDAYTIKKVLPRILLAAIGITLSWPLLEFLVTFSNALGVGIRSLIYAPFDEAGVNTIVLGGGSSALGVLFAGGAFAALGALGLLSFIATAALAIFIAFFILVLRNILVLLLIILAPIAIAMYVMPNTEKYWKIWWEWLFKALMVFPIITAMIAVGHVFAAIASEKGGALSTFVAFAAYFAPYFLIPAAFRFAGGALSTIGGFTNNSSRGAFDRLSKFRQNQSAKNGAAMRAGTRFQGTQYVPGTRKAAGLFNAATAGATTGVNGRFGVGAKGAEALDQKRRLVAQDLMKDSRFIGIKDDDNALRALTYKDYDSAKQGLMDDFKIKEADADRAVNSARASGLGFGQPQAIAAAQQLVNTGTGYDNVQQLTETLARASGGNKSTGAGLAGFANSVTKSAGRHDLAPGFESLNNAVQDQIATDAQFKDRSVPLEESRYDELRSNAWQSASLYQHANDKPKNIKAAIQHHKKILEEGMSGSGDVEVDRKKMQDAAIFFNELKSMQPNAGGDVAQEINKVLSVEEGVGTQLHDVVNNRLSETPSSPVTDKRYNTLDAAGISVTRTRQESSKERIDRLSRGYERPDPNNIN